MIIWGALLIPLFLSLLAILKFKKEINFLEILPGFIISAICIFGFKACEESVQVQDQEVLMDYVVKAEYYERWDEWIEETCSRSCCCNSKGENCKTEYYDCSYRKEHSPYWVLILSSGKEINISEDWYYKLTKQFGNQNSVDMKRDFYRIDGDKYETYFKGEFDKIEYYSWSQNYENRIQASHNVFNYRDVDTAQQRFLGLYDYPKSLEGNNIQSIIGYQSTNLNTLNNKLNRWNSLLGNKKQVKVWFLIYDNKPRTAGMIQETYWKGGNKNEFIVCIGLDKNKNIKWSHVFSWTKKIHLKNQIRDLIINQKQLNDQTFDYILNQTMTEVDKQFERRHFKEFNYLTVEPPTWCIITTYIVVLLISIGSLLWAITNDIDSKGKINYYYKRKF